ncbi:MAG: InlB B-repeat-containing protein [Lachnospiraceae bacterium]|nr:InlB B-repeat-containing protein [Lachnospiraceae bacterium]
MTYDSTYGVLPVPSRTGYTFKGWYTGADGQGSKVGNTTLVTATSDHTLHACWKDETAPGQPVLQDGETLPAGWTNTQNTIPLKLYDGVGVTGLLVSVDGNPYTEVSGFSGGTGSVNYNYAVLDSEHTYQFKAVDATDNVSEESAVFTVKLDQTKPVIGTITYENKAANLWQWLIGKTSMIVHVPVTETGSGVTKITYTLTPRDAAGNLDSSNAVTKIAAVKDGEAKLTFDADFRGTITINCTDAAGNAADGVTIGKDAGGVIVEDHAPDITTDAKTDYYDTAAAINVTVKDDTGNAITSGIASVTYQVGDGMAKSVTVDTSALQTQVTFTIPASEIPTGITEIKITAEDNAGNEAAKSITVKVKGPEKQPAAEIDYREEELTGLAPNGVYSIGGTEYTADRQGHIPIIEGWFGNTVSIIKKGNGNETTDSPAQSLPVPARPAKPTPTGVDVSTAGGTGRLTGLTADTAYEVSTDGGKTWVSHTADGNGEITALASGTYVVRVKAGTSNFVSEPSDSAKIGAFQIKVTFTVDGTVYKEISVDYGTTLTDIPSVPIKNGKVGDWCVDAQGSSLAEFTNITADMTVYAVYTTAYTVTLQGGTGYTLSAVNDSKSPVKEGGSFTFRFELKEGYHRVSGSFAVTVNSAKVELTNDTYTITDIREDQTVAVAGVEKDADNPSSGGGDNDDGGSEPTPTPTPQPTQPPTDTPTPTPQPPSPINPPEQPQPTEKPDDKPESVPSTPDNSQPGDKQESENTGTPEPTEQTVPATVDNRKIVISGEPVATGNVKGMTDTRTVLEVGNGAVIVTIVCTEQEYTAGVADTLAVANAVLAPEQIELVNNGETIEIRIDVKDISEQVPERDKEIIENSISEFQKEVPGLTLGMYVDISMFIRIGEGDWNAITTTKEPIEVIIGIPEKLQEKGRAYYIIRAHEGVSTFMNDMDDEPSTITVSTDLFSSYAIAYVQAEGTGHKCGLCHICPTFLGICYFIWLAIIIALILISWIVIRRNSRKQDEQES